MELSMAFLFLFHNLFGSFLAAYVVAQVDFSGYRCATLGSSKFDGGMLLAAWPCVGLPGCRRDGLEARDTSRNWPDPSIGGLAGVSSLQRLAPRTACDIELRGRQGNRLGGFTEGARVVREIH